MTDRPILWSFRRCPYAMRARLALDVSGVEIEHREILLRDKPAAFLAASPTATVPALEFDDGTSLDESFDIMLWALEQNDPEHWLPNDDTRDAVMQLIEEADGPFKHHLDRYKYATRYDGAVAEEHRTAGGEFLMKLDARLGEAPFLGVSQPGLADMAIAPFVRQFANTDRGWFDVQPWVNLRRWLEAFLASDRFQRIMMKHPVWATSE